METQNVQMSAIQTSTWERTIEANIQDKFDIIWKSIEGGGGVSNFEIRCFSFKMKGNQQLKIENKKPRGLALCLTRWNTMTTKKMDSIEI